MLIDDSIVRYKYDTDPHKDNRLFKTTIKVLIAVSVISLMFTLLQPPSLPSQQPGIPAEANIGSREVVAMLRTIFSLIAGLMYLHWVYRSNKNCHGFGAKEMLFTPGWSVGYHFVPFLNLIRPYEIVQEIYRVSKDPVDWRSKPGSASPLVSCWWTAAILNATGNFIASIMLLNASSPSDMQFAMTGITICNLLSIAVALMLLRIIDNISNLQDQLVQGHLHTQHTEAEVAEYFEEDVSENFGLQD